jgi:glycosyltransferase involved in cell wall biosynthesis
MTLVSIITPSYNQAAYLEQTLRSVLEQDYAPIEYLVVDGGSTDGSVEILQRYAARLSWWVSERDRGQAEAINKGLARARGEIVAWLNSDDLYLPGAVKAAVQALEAHPRAAFVYGDVLSVDAQGRPFHHQRYRPLTLQDLLCFHIIGQPAVFMRRDALEQAGRLDPSYHYLLDHHLWIRLAQVGEMVYVPQLWAAARYHPMAKNRRQALAFGEEAFRILDWAEAQPELGGILRPIRRRARAGAFFLQARYLRDGGDTWKALRSWHQGLFLAPSLLPRHFSLGVSIWLSALGLDSLRHLVLRHREKQAKQKAGILDGR